MTNLVLGIVGALILVILLMLFRIQSLLSINTKSASDIGANSSNRFNGLLMLIVPILGAIAVIWYTPIAAESFLPEASSEHGLVTDRLFWISIAVISVMFIVTNAALFYFAYRYQYRKDKKASFYHDNPQLEVFWTIVPAVIMALLVFFGWKAWSDITSDPPEDALAVEIVGKQFNWYVRYPGEDGKLGKHDFRLINDGAGNELGVDFEDKASEDDFVPRELHIPVGKPVVFKIRARDVLHSVFAPHFRLKMDAVPGMRTQFHFVPTKTTAQMIAETGNPDFTYEIACAQICGRGHFAMRLIVVVEEEEEYEKWVAEQSTILEGNPDLKGKGLSDLRKKNLAKQKENTKKDKTASL